MGRLTPAGTGHERRDGFDLAEPAVWRPLLPARDAATRRVMRRSRRVVVPPLNETRAVVTGSTSGLGRAMAEALVAAGAAVAVTSRHLERAETRARELGPRAVGLALDVRDEQSVAAFVDRAHDHLGGIDLLVNNAGIGMRTVNPQFLAHAQPFWQVRPNGFRDVFDTKVMGLFLVARAIAPLMLEAGSGRIVNISMSQATMTRRGFVPYGPSGAAVEALSRIMAADLDGTPVTVNVLLPGGPTATGMVPDDVPADVRARLLDPAIMGPPIVWLASSEADGVHGQRIVARDFEQFLAQRALFGSSRGRSRSRHRERTGSKPRAS